MAIFSLLIVVLERDEHELECGLWLNYEQNHELNQARRFICDGFMAP